MITLAGKPMLLEDPGVDLHSWMRRYQDLSDLRLSGRLPVAVESSRTASRAGQKSGVGLPVPNYAAERELKINTLYWPTGATRWAHGLYLTDEATAKSFTSGSQIKLKFGDEDHSFLFVDMWVLTPHPVSAFDSDDEGENLWLVPIVDDRYWWQFYDIGDFEVDGGSTWGDIYKEIGEIVGHDISVGTIESDYLHPDPVELTRRYDNVAVLLDAIAASVGHRIVFRFFNDEFFLESQSDLAAKVAYATNLAVPHEVAAGGKFTEKHHIPSRVQVTFPNWTYGVPWCDGDLHRVTITPSGSDPRPDDTIKVIHSSTYADFTDVPAGSAPTNQSTLGSLAQVISDDFYAWHTDSYDWTFNGAKAWLLNGLDDCVEWYFGQQLDDGGYRALTRVTSQPHNFGVEQQLSQHFNWTVLDHWQIGKLDADLTPIDQNGTGYAIASVWDTVAGAEVDTGFDIKVYEWLGIPWQAGDKLWFRWHCEENAWYAFGPANSNGTVLFSLNEDRSRETGGDGKYFGQAEATVEAIIGRVPVVVGDTINVIFGGQRWLGAVGPNYSRSGKGCEGIADYYFDDGDKWIVKECQELTAKFWFLTDEDRAPLVPDEDIDVAGVTKLIGRSNADWPVTNWKQIGGNDPLKVRFHGTTYPYAFEGALGVADLDVDITNVIDNSTMRYIVSECNQGALINEVEHEPFCPGGEPAISNHHPVTWFPFGQRWPSEKISFALDRMALASMEGGVGYTVFNDTMKKHIIVNTEHEELAFLTPPGENCDAPKEQKFQGMRCKPETPASGYALDYALTEVAIAYEDTDAGGTGEGQECSDPKLKLNYKRRPFWYCGAESALVSSTLNLEQILVTTDVDYTDNCIVQEQTHVIVFASCDTIDDSVICTTDEQCDSSGE